MVDLLPETELRQMVEGTRAVLENSVSVMSTHAEYIAQNCRAHPL